MMPNTPKKLFAAFAMAGLAVASPLLAAKTKPAPKAPAMAPADVIKARTNHFKEMGAGFKGVMDQIKSSNPSIIDIRQSVKPIVAASTGIYAWFPKGSGPESGQKTGAKPEIWSDPVKFKAAQDAFSAQAKAMGAAADSGNIDAVKAQAMKLGGTCKGCHDSFKSKEEHH